MAANLVNIPSGWQRVAIGNCVTERRKSPIKVDDAANYGPYPFFTSGEGVLQHNEALIDGETLFLATGGVANVKYFEGKAAYSTDTYALGAKDGYDTKFLYYLLLFLRDYINTNFFQGSGLKHLKKKDLKSFEIAVPLSKEEQIRISDALSEVDEAIAQTDALISKYESIKKGLMADLLTNGIDPAGNIRSESTHQYKDSPIGRIPAEWEVTTFANLSGGIKDYIKTGPFGSSLKGEHWRETGVPVITIGSLGEDSFIEENLLYIDEEKAEELSAYALKEGDILFSRVADVGRSLIIDKEHSGWVMSSNFMRLRIDQSLMSPMVINHIIKFSARFKEQISRNVNNSGRSVTNTAILNSFIIPYIPIDEQQRILKVIEQNTANINALIVEREKITLTKQGLLSDLITGKVRV